ncbi:MAG: hypothetical protein AB3N23_22315 [Paracoccaceae bacterium]
MRFAASLFALLSLSAPAFAACVDGADGPQRAPFEILKASVLNGDFESAASQIDLGGNRENEIVAALSRLGRAGVTSFEHCILLRRQMHSPNFTSEIVYYTDGADREYWLLISGVQIDGETRLIDVQLSESYKRFREWLQ